MKKIFYSLFIVAALAASTSVMANNDTKKESDCKAKTEKCEKKKDACSDEKKDKACSDKKKKDTCPEKKAACDTKCDKAKETKSCGKK